MMVVAAPAQLLGLAERDILPMLLGLKVSIRLDQDEPKLAVNLGMTNTTPRENNAKSIIGFLINVSILNPFRGFISVC